MKYLANIFFLMTFLLIADVFMANFFYSSTPSALAAFLPALAFFLTEESKRPFRDIFPIATLIAFVSDGLSSLPPGVIFTTVFIQTLLTVQIAKKIPGSQKADWHILILLFFLLLFAFRAALIVLFSDISYPIFFRSIGENLFTAFINALISYVFYVFLRLNPQGALIKIFLRKES